MAFIGPKSTLGIIDDGQSTFLLTQQALKMGFQVVVLSQKSFLMNYDDIRLIKGSCHDLRKLQQLFASADVVVYNNESMHLDLLDQIKGKEKLVQGTSILDIVQDRYIEKSFLNSLNMNIAPYAAVVDYDDLCKVVQEIGFPCILKPIQKDISIVDGVIFHNQAEIDRYEMPSGSYLLESYLDIKQEMSVLVSKSNNQQVDVFPTIKLTSENRWVSTAMINRENNLEFKATIKDIAKTIAASLDYQGVFGIKFCITKNGMLYVERIYPGTIYAGSIYQEATSYSQEELFIRSSCGWPLPDLTPMIDACNLTITDDNLAFAITALDKHPQWKINFLPQRLRNNSLTPYLGAITVYGESERQLRNYINPLGLWKLQEN